MGTDAKLPFAGLRVLDFTWGGAGPFATKMLADYGAEVIKVETSTRYDFTRIGGPFAKGVKGTNRSAYFANRNTNKFSVALNFKTREAVGIAKRLVRVCDIVVNNFRAGVMEKLGLGYQELAAIRDDIIYVSMPLQGSAGPQFGYAGVGNTLNAVSGIFYLTSYEDGPSIGPGTNFPDHSVNPGHAFAAIIAALIHRRKTGKGQMIEISQFESTVNLLGPSILHRSASGENPRPQGNSSTEAAPYGVFPCRGGEWIALAVATDRQWHGLCDVAGEPGWLADPRFKTFASRLDNAAVLNALVAAWTEQGEVGALMETLQAKGVPAGHVQDSKDLVESDPQLAAREHFVTIEHPEMGPTVYNNVPFRLSKTPAKFAAGAPLLGQHTHNVLGRLLGLTAEELASFDAAGAFK
jgi:benzylsuccinate CoA-transferase BbsF subunit